jgi:hypothetical protein
MRQPDWTEGQFRVLLAHPDLSSEAISGLIPRSTGAIDVVRSGIGDYRRGGSSGILSKMMRELLAVS